MSMSKKRLLLGAFLLFVFLIGLRFLLFDQEGVFCNHAIGFGFFSHTEYFLGVEGLLIFLVFIFLYKSKYFSEGLIFSILLAGGIANIFERVYFGCVLDYLTLPFIQSHVNVADILITGALISLLFSGNKNQK